jgi:hypothetical protein
MYLILCFILLFKYCNSSGITKYAQSTNLLSIDNTLIKQNVFHMRCQYDDLNTGDISGVFTTTEGADITIDCPKVTVKYDSNNFGFIPEETYIKTISVCESGTSPLWDYNTRDNDDLSQSRRLQLTSSKYYFFILNIPNLKIGIITQTFLLNVTEQKYSLICNLNLLYYR